MKKITAVILAIIIALSCLSAFGFAAEAGITDFAIASTNPVAATDDDGNAVPVAEKKTSWFKSDAGKYYLFVPNSIGTDSVKVSVSPATATVKVDGAQVKDGDIISLAGKSTIKVEDNSGAYDVAIIAESKTATVFIDLADGDLEFVHEKKGNEVEGAVSIIGADGESVEYAGAFEIKGRGNSTWQMEKKPYNIKLDEKTNLFGMGKTKKWSLIANHGDDSLIRNVLAYQAAENAGMSYVPQFTPVDVYIDNDYMGAYLLTTRVGVDKSNVDIDDLEGDTEDANAEDLDTYPRAGAYGKYAGLLAGTKKWFDIPNEPDYVNGGYIIEMELANRYADELSGFVTTRNQPFTMKSPECLTKSQIDYISEYYQKFEDAVYAGVSMEELNKICDVKSLADIYLINEWCSNQDFGLTSTYFYKPVDDVLYAGPVWDFDIGFGNNDSNRFGNDYTDPTKWTVCYNRMYRNTVFGAWDIDEQPTVFNVLTKNEGFVKVLEKCWKDYMLVAVNETVRWATEEYIPATAGSALANAIRWNIFGTDDITKIKSLYASSTVEATSFASIKADTINKSVGSVQKNAPETNMVLKALKGVLVGVNNLFEKAIVLFGAENN